VIAALMQRTPPIVLPICRSSVGRYGTGVKSPLFSFSANALIISLLAAQSSINAMTRLGGEIFELELVGHMICDVRLFFATLQRRL